MRIAFFEDQAAVGFGPLSLTRPVFELVCGAQTMRERVVRHFGCSEWGAFLRNRLAEVYREEHPAARVNDFLWLAQEPTLLLNGRWLPTARALESIGGDDVGLVGDSIAWLTLDPLEAQLLTEQSWNDVLGRLVRSRRLVETEGVVVERPWDLVDHNSQQLVDDFENDDARGSSSHSNVEILGPPERVRIAESASIDPFVVLDARGGPITIADDARIEAFTRIEGPCHVGAGSQLFRANVRGGTTIGPVCRVGGEVEASVLHGYVNKYHEGFLGHSYVCPWVNLGALSSSSDLKSDYSTVRVPLAGGMVDSERTKVGCFIGDHTKTALASLFNTGSSIGVMSMVLPGGELLPKHVPSFSRIWHGELDDGVNFESALETARTAMARRDCTLTDASARLLRFLDEESKPERNAAIKRQQERLRARNERSWSAA